MTTLRSRVASCVLVFAVLSGVWVARWCVAPVGSASLNSSDAAPSSDVVADDPIVEVAPPVEFVATKPERLEPVPPLGPIVIPELNPSVPQPALYPPAYMPTMPVDSGTNPSSVGFGGPGVGRGGRITFGTP
jgi:hypothetical protein